MYCNNEYGTTHINSNFQRGKGILARYYVFSNLQYYCFCYGQNMGGRVLNSKHVHHYNKPQCFIINISPKALRCNLYEYYYLNTATKLLFGSNHPVIFNILIRQDC